MLIIASNWRELFGLPFGGMPPSPALRRLPSTVVDSSGTTAPPVVGVLVVHDPGPWFDEVLYALAHQDYPNLNLLFLVAGEPGEIPQKIKAQLPNAFVRGVPANPGFGAAANEAIRLVEGSGFFCFMHDDVALTPNAISALVEEMYRSNAGIVGPKLVEWDDPGVLQHVGNGVDRFGEVDPLVEPGELDQEQHDAVRDVFSVPTACLLIRADLFRALGGFPTGYDYHGEDLDLCWRTHLNGARVLVVPAAVARHRGVLTQRRRDIGHRRAIARHRIDTVATMTGRWRTPVVLVQLAVVSIVETIVGLFTGRAKDGLASLYALVGLPTRVIGVLARRRQIRPLREVPDREIAHLQMRGSARLAMFVRHQRNKTGAKMRALPTVRRAQTATTSVIVRIVVAVLAIFGSRSLITRGVGQIGQFAEIPNSGDLLRRYVAGWDPQGFGRAGNPPTAHAIVGLIEALPLPGGFTRLLLVLGPLAAGYWGAWRLGGFFPSVRARVAALAVYAAVPLPYAAIAAGRWGVLAAYGGFPWAMDLVRRASGIGVVATQEWGDDDIADAVVGVPTGERIRVLVSLGLLCGVVAAFVPVFPVLVLAAAVLFAVGTVIARGSTTVLAGVATAAGALLIAVLLNLPWATTLVRDGGWGDLLGAAPAGPSALGLIAVVTFGIGATVLGLAALGLYVPLVAAPLVGRGWRLTWASRAACQALGFALIAVLADRGSLAIRMPELGLLLVPVACGLSLSGACAVAAFEHDVRGARLGWRQPLGLAIGVGLVVGLVPGAAASFEGSWSMPSLGLSTFMRQLPAATAAARGATTPAGDYRVLFIGDPRLLPAPGRSLYPGVAYTVVDDGPVTVESQFLAAEGAGDRVARDALTAIASVSTARVGRLLATLGVRYVVIPVDDGIDHPDAAIGVPAGLLEALSAQLDLSRFPSSDQVVIYENNAWLPVRSMLDPSAVAASTEGGAEAIATGNLGSGAAVLVGSDPAKAATQNVAGGTLNLAFEHPEDWSVVVDGKAAVGRAAFGWSSAFDVPTGALTVEHRPVGGRRQLIIGQVVLWLLAAFVATGGIGKLRLPGRRPPPHDAPVIDFSAMAPDAPLPPMADLPAELGRR